jgi:hypothetical protein
MSAEARHIHLVGAIGTIRTAKYQGRDHVVVPVVALVEGVIFPINAETPELVLAKELAVAPQSWNGRPIFPNHPVENGTQVSGNAPHILESQAIGTIFNARLEGKRLKMDAYLDPERAAAVGPIGIAVLERARKGEMIEVSVGAFVTTETKQGVFNGKSYKAVWKEVIPDHLAMLPKGTVGACSIAMGCGSPRVAAGHAPVHLLTAEGFALQDELVEAHLEAEAEKETITEEKPVERRSLRERIVGLISAAFDEQVIEKAEAEVEVKEPETAELVDAAGARHSKGDNEMIQLMHDKAVALGASCAPPAEEKPDLTAAERFAQAHAEEFAAFTAAEGSDKLAGDETPAQEVDMNKQERVKALIASPKSPFTACDQTMLEAASEERLVALEQHVKSLAEAEQQNAELGQRVTAAEAKVAEFAAAAAKPKTDDEWLASAPASVRALVDGAKAQEAARKAELVGALKTAQSEFNEEELNGMSVKELERISRVAGVKAAAAPVDFSAQAPRVAKTGDNDAIPAPPDMNARIKAAASKR